jgi:hypothetical protein
MQGLKQGEDGQEAMDEEDVDPPLDVHTGGDADMPQPLPGIFDDVKVEPDLKEEDDPGDLEVMLDICPTLVAVPVGAGNIGGLWLGCGASRCFWMFPQGPMPSPATGRALSAEATLQLRKAAFTRILIGAHSASEAFRGPLLARLATEVGSSHTAEHF